MTAGGLTTGAAPGTLPNADYWVDKLGLVPTAVGGLFAPTFAGDNQLLHSALPERFTGDRRGYSANYYLLQQGFFLAMHQLNQDELWNFYMGSPVRLHVFGTSYSTVTIGPDIDAGQALQGVAPHNTWFGGELVGDEPYVLVGCSLAPGYDPRDSSRPTAADIGALVKAFPDQQAIIERLTAGS